MSAGDPPRELRLLAGGEWLPAGGGAAPVIDPATGDAVASVRSAAEADVDRVVRACAEAYPAWRDTPVVERVQPLFRLKALLERDLDELARGIVRECGKTLAEAKGELRRGIENVEVACGMPSLMRGTALEDVARGIDESMIRQPLGVVAAITPFNFPAMIPLWFLPYAVATGNTFVLKPSDRVPTTAEAIVRLGEEAGFPPGVLGLVHGGKEAVDALTAHDEVRAISFVGSTPVARHVYARSTAHGKRAQCQGGAKNPAVVLPDADLDLSTRILADSAFGCAGQRCLATSVAIAVGEARGPLLERIVADAERRSVGSGLDEDVAMGPVISEASRERTLSLIETGVQEGASLAAGGGPATVEGYEDGYFVQPTVLDGVAPAGTLARTEVFGPVLSVMPADSIDEAIRLANDRAYGNQACLFTSSGAAARAFRHQVRAGNVGINLGVAAPMAFFPFSGWNESFFGDLHAQGAHAVEFYTQTKVVIERWPPEWSRRF